MDLKQNTTFVSGKDIRVFLSVNMMVLLEVYGLSGPEGTLMDKIHFTVKVVAKYLIPFSGTKNSFCKVDICWIIARWK